MMPTNDSITIDTDKEKRIKYKNKMLTVSIHDAERQLASLVEQAARGTAFIISKAGRPMVKVIPFTSDTETSRRLGFMVGEITVPEDFDQMASEEIVHFFSESKG